MYDQPQREDDRNRKFLVHVGRQRRSRISAGMLFHTEGDINENE